MNRRPLVYLAGPIGPPHSGPQMLMNVGKAYEDAERLRAAGIDVFVPHSTVFVAHALNLTVEDWLLFDFNIIYRCDALVRIPGRSPGSDREVVFARENNILTFVDAYPGDDVVERCIAHFGKVPPHGDTHGY